MCADDIMSNTWTVYIEDLGKIVNVTGLKEEILFYNKKTLPSAGNFNRYRRSY
jgi:hypothetical protein